MLKICIITHSYPRFSGDWRSNFIQALARAYARAGADVTVFVPLTAGYRHESIDADGVKVVNFRYLPLQSMHTIGYGRTMRQDLGVAPADILRMPFLLLFGTIRFAFLLRRERFDMVQAHWAVPNAVIALAGRWLAGSPAKVMTSFPGSDVTVLKSAGFLGRLLCRVIARSDYLSCNSPDLKEDLVNTGLFRREIDQVIYGVDDGAVRYTEAGRTRLRAQWGASADTIVLLMIGRFVPKKGFTTAFQALRTITGRMQNVLLVVVGEGPLKAEYEQVLANDRTASYVRFIGEIPTQELSAHYSACDIFLMPSRRLPSDGLNVVVPEAMACGRPVIASRAGGNDLVVFPGKNGFLHDENDPEQLAGLVVRLAADSQTRAEMGRQSEQLVNERFNWHAIARYYVGRYRALADQSGQDHAA